MSDNIIIASPDIYPDSVKSLESYGYKYVSSFKNPNVLSPLRYHVDMQLCRVDYNTFVSAPESFLYYENILKNVNLLKGDTYLSCNYPADIAYNILVNQSLAIGNFKHTDNVIKNNLCDRIIINVSQGYTACTLCEVADKAYITSDIGLYKTLNLHEIDILLVDDKSILLPGFNHGFIGGSSVKLSSDMLAFNGNIKLHPNYGNIKSFCLNYNVNIESLSYEAIMDIGSFVIV